MVQFWLLHSDALVKGDASRGISTRSNTKYKEPIMMRKHCKLHRVKLSEEHERANQRLGSSKIIVQLLRNLSHHRSFLFAFSFPQFWWARYESDAWKKEKLEV